MFEQSFLSNGKTRRTWTVVVAFGGQVLAICILVATPLFFIEAPSVTQLTTTWLAVPPPPPPPPPPPLAQARAAKETHKTPRKFETSQLIAPRTIPKEVTTFQDVQMSAPLSAGGVIGGVPGGVPGGVLEVVIGSLPMAATPPPPPPQKAELPKPVERIRIGGNIQAALLIHQIDPQYPLLARQAHVEGSVVLRAIIDRDGKVQNLVLVSGNPLLVQAAMDAVRRWVYKPTYLNGNPVEVLTEVSLNFHLTSSGYGGGG
jgi:protein TonB